MGKGMVYQGMVLCSLTMTLLSDFLWACGVPGTSGHPANSVGHSVGHSLDPMVRCVQLAGYFSTKFLQFPMLTAPMLTYIAVIPVSAR